MIIYLITSKRFQFVCTKCTDLVSNLVKNAFRFSFVINMTVMLPCGVRKDGSTRWSTQWKRWNWDRQRLDWKAVTMQFWLHWNVPHPNWHRIKRKLSPSMIIWAFPLLGSQPMLVCWAVICVKNAWTTSIHSIPFIRWIGWFPIWEIVCKHVHNATIDVRMVLVYWLPATTIKGRKFLRSFQAPIISAVKPCQSVHDHKVHVPTWRSIWTHSPIQRKTNWSNTVWKRSKEHCPMKIF